MRRVGPAALLLLALALRAPAAADAQNASGAAAIHEIIRFHSAFETFSDLYDAVSTGRYDIFSPADVAASLLECECGLTALERDAVLDTLLRMTGDGEASAVDAARRTELIATLLGRFGQLGDHGLRARVLRAAADAGLDGTALAVRESAARLSSMLRDSGRNPATGGYEIEAVVLASVAPGYPSGALAEQLRVIAAYSSDRRVVTAARAAARAILRDIAEAGES